MDIASTTSVKFIIKDGILIAEWLSKYYTLEMVNEGIVKRKELTQGKDYPMLSCMNGAICGTREARLRITDNDAQEGVKALAVLVKNKVQWVYSTLALTMCKPALPCKIFTNNEEALNWLKQYK